LAHHDRIASKEMIKALTELDGADAMWAEFRGASGNERPRKLTENALAALLRPFGIRPRTAWPLGRTMTSKSFRGYFRADFEIAGHRTVMKASHRHSLRKSDG
jgi:hypothetical protein